MGNLPTGTTVSHYRAHEGAEVDFVLEKADREIMAVEIKRTLSPKLTPALVESMNTLKADRGVILIPKGESLPPPKTLTAISLQAFLESLA